jgi:hypothetical protein
LWGSFPIGGGQPDNSILLEALQDTFTKFTLKIQETI